MFSFAEDFKTDFKGVKIKTCDLWERRDELIEK